VIDQNHEPLVSVVIPTRNRAELLAAAVRSVLDQTYRNFELIIVDDASEDGTREMVARLSDPRIRYIRHDAVKGGGAARNTGIRSSRGEYISFLDDDDEWLPSKLELQVGYLERKRSADVVYTGLSVRELDSGKPAGKVVPLKRGDIFADLLAGNCVGTASSVILRRDCLDTGDLFDENLPSCQDWDMWLKLSKSCRFDYISEPLVVYHLHGKRITSSDESALAGREMVFEKYRDEIESDRSLSGRHHLMIGSLYCRLGEMKRGREEIRESIRLRPGSVTGLATYAASLLGSRVYSLLYTYTPTRWKWRIVRSAA